MLQEMQWSDDVQNGFEESQLLFILVLDKK
jgi:hypothetical protein